MWLEPLQKADTQYLQALGQDSAVFRFIPEIAVPFDATRWVNEKLNTPENYICHVVRLRKEALPIGYVQVSRRSNLELQLGYWLGKKYWGKNFGLEAACLSLLLFKAAGGGGRIFAAAFPENVASVRILQRLGFSLHIESKPTSVVAEGMNDYVLHL